MKQHHITVYSGCLSSRMTVVISVVLAVLANNAKAESITHTFNFCADSLSVNTMTSPDNKQYSLISYQGLETLDSPGTPALPMITARFIVPTLSRNHKISVTQFRQSHHVGLDYIPYPSQDKCPNYGVSAVFTTPDMASYTASDGTPAVRIMDNALWDGDCRILTVAVSPCGYNGKTNGISVCSDVEISIDFDMCSREEAGLLSTAPLINRKNLDIESQIVNAEDIPSEMRSPAKIYSRFPTEFKGNYYIITNASLVPYFHDLALWKRQKGYDVTVKSVESIINDSRFKPDGTSGREDNAAAVRSYLINEYNNKSGNIYCLLAGNDEAGLPIRYVKDMEIVSRESILPSDPYYNVPAGRTFTPTDNYLCDMTTNWNLYWDQGAKIYTCIADSVRVSMNIAVGRLMCRTRNEISNYTNKLILYESNPGYGDNDYLGRIFFSEQEDMDGESDIVLRGFNWYEEDQIDILKDHLITEGTAGPDGRNLITAMRNHGYVSIHGHGTPEMIGVSGCLIKRHNYYQKPPHTGITALDSYDIVPDYDILKIESGNGLDNLNNASKPFVLYSIACTTNPFDNYTSRDGSMFRDRYTYNMGESFTLGKYGGPAFLSNTRDGWVHTSARMEKNFGMAINEIQSPKIGWLENRSKELTTNSHIRLCHSLIGEPEFELWTKKPQSLGISFDVVGSAVRITGIGLKGSTISITDGVNKSAITNITDNYYSFPLSNFKSSTLVCSVWKTGHLPVIKLFANNGTLSDERSFIVRDAHIGKDNPYNVNAGGVLDVKAIDFIDVHDLSVSAGRINFNCDNVINVDTLIGRNKADINLCGDIVELKPGFSIESGSVLNISNPNYSKK